MILQANRLYYSTSVIVHDTRATVVSTRVQCYYCMLTHTQKHV